MDNSNMKVFRFHGNCFLIQGKNSNLIYDLDRQRYFELSDLAFEIFGTQESFEVNNILSKYPQYKAGINKYIDYFLSNDYGFLTNDYHLFKKPEKQWDSYFDLEHLSICFPKERTIGELTQIFNNQNVRNVSIYINNEEELSSLHNYILAKNLNFALALNIHVKCDNVPKGLFKSLIENVDNLYKIFFYKDYGEKLNIDSSNKIEIRKEIAFLMYEFVLTDLYPHLNFFFEAHNYNANLNKALFVDSHGNVKNHFSHKTIIGNIWQNNILEILKSKILNKYWNTRFDEIQVCKHCSYRYMCNNPSEIIFGNTVKLKQYCGVVSKSITDS